MTANRGQVGSSLWILMIAIVVIVIFIFFNAEIRNYIIGGLGSLISMISKTGGTSGNGGLAPSSTNFTAYDCVGGTCSPFQSQNYMWAIDYNGQNESDHVNVTLEFAGTTGNYSVLVYPIYTGTEILCSNITSQTQIVKGAYLKSGYNYTVYYKLCG